MSTASASLSARHDLVKKQIDELIALAKRHELHDVAAPKVSKWTVGKQLEHLLLSHDSILDVLERLIDGRQSPAPGGKTFIGRMVLATGFIPRGAGKAPGHSPTPTAHQAV